MKKLINNIFKNRKYNTAMIIAALSMLIISLSAVTYCWIESSNDIKVISSDNASASTAIADTNGTVNITVGNSDVVSLNRYIDNIDNLFLAPAKMDGITLQILRDGGSYTPATTNDIGNNYIEFDVPFTVNSPSIFKFTEDSGITVGSSETNPVRVSVSLDGGEPKVFNSTLVNVDNSDGNDRVAFSSRTGKHNLKVKIWLDTTDGEYNSLKGGNVNIKLNLISEVDTTKPTVTIKSNPYANITAYVNSVAVDLDEKIYVDPGAQISLKAETGAGKLITSGVNQKLNGHKFEKFTAEIGGVPSDISTSSSSESGNILTTNAVYTVPSDGNYAIVINTSTKVDTYRLGGVNMMFKNSTGNYSTFGNSWNENNCGTMEYNEDLNCVYAVMQITSASSSKFKIAAGENFKSSYRDNINYSVPPNIDVNTQVITNGITGFSIPNESQTSNNCFLYTSPVYTDVLVVYYLDTNRVEFNTDTELKKTLTATAVGGGDCGTATVNAGSEYDSATAGAGVSIKRNAADRSVTFHAVPNSGYKFVGWSTEADSTTYESTEASYTVTLASDKTLYANYKKCCNVTVTNASAVDYDTNETITFTNNQATVIEGSNLNFTATLPDSANAYKVTWIINGTEMNPQTVTPGNNSTYLINNITSDQTVAVSYEKLMKLTVSASGCTYTAKDANNNNITFSENVAYVDSGTVAAFTAISSEEGYYNIKWTGGEGKEINLTDDNTTNKTDSYTTAAITSDTTVTVTFKKLYKITVNLDSKSLDGSTVISKVISKVNGANLVTLYQPADTVIDMTASNTNTTDYPQYKISADWTIKYGDNSTAEDRNTRTHTETISATKGDVTVTVLVKEEECSQDILKGNKVSFYAGYSTSWDSNTLINLNKDSNTTAATVNNADFRTITINSADYYVGSFVELDSYQYYISNIAPSSSRTGDRISEAAQGGKTYVSNASNTIVTVAATTGTTTVSSTSVNLNSTESVTLSTTVSALKSSAGTDLYLQYYALNASTDNYDLIYSSKALTSTSNSVTKDLSSYFTIAGNLTIKTVLSDGTVYYVADTDTIKVVDPNAQTITVNQPSTNTILFVDDSKITISKANYIHAWVNGGAIITNTNDNSRTPLDSFTGNSFKYKNFDTFSSAWQSTASGKNIYFKLMINNKWDNNDGYKAVEDSTLQMGKQIYTASANSYSAFTPLCISSITRSGALTSGNTISMSLTASGGTPWYFDTQRSSSEAAKYKLTVTDKVGSTTTTVISGREFTYNTDSRTVYFIWKPTATGTHTLTFTLTTNDGADSVTYTNSSDFVIS